MTTPDDFSAVVEDCGSHSGNGECLGDIATTINGNGSNVLGAAYGVIDPVNSPLPHSLKEIRLKLRALKNRQTAALSSVTKKRNEISLFMNAYNNVHTVKTHLECYEELFNEYNERFREHSELLVESDGDYDAELQRFENRESSIRAFRNEVLEWISKAENRLSEELDGACRTTSGSSKKSSSSKLSTKSEKARVQAKLAELLVEKSLLRKRQELQFKEKELDLEFAIAKARAREKVLTGSSKNPVNVNDDIVNSASNIEGSTLVPNKDSTADSKCIPPLNVQPPADSLHADASQMVELQQLYNTQMLETHRTLVSAMTLPTPQIIKFKGDPVEYNSFQLAFQTRIESHSVSSADRLYFLQQHLEGEPRQLIEGCLLMDPDRGYAEAWRLLRSEYGDSYKISMAYMDKLLSWNQLHYEDCGALKRFSFFLIKCLNAMQSIQDMIILNHPPNMQSIVRKLPAYLQNQWRDRVCKLRKNEFRVPQFGDLVAFVKDSAESVNDPIYGKEALGKGSQPAKLGNKNAQPCRIGKESSGSHKSANFSLSITKGDSFNGGKCEDTRKCEDTKVKRKLFCQMCKGPHDIENCSKYLSMNIEDRRKFLKSKLLCFGCFRPNHTSKGCLQRRICKTCSKRHPSTLHDNDFVSLQHNEYVPSSQQNVSAFGQVIVPQMSSHSTTTSSCHVGCSSVVLHAILPVKVAYQTSGKMVSTYALYDNGSDGCFITEELKEDLDAMGSKASLELKTMHGVSFIDSCKISNLAVSDLDGNNCITLPDTFTMKEIPVNHNQIPRSGVLRKLPHLESIADFIPEYQPQLRIGMLIGSNCPLALEPLKIVRSCEDGPYAALLRHGWTVHGPVRVHYNAGSLSCQRIMIKEAASVKEQIAPIDVLKVLEKDFCEKDSGSYPGEKGLSREDEKFLQRSSLEKKFINGHYVLPLPFRDSDIQMPNNKSQAVKRILWQKKKMLRDPKYREHYTSFMDDILEKGYAAEVPEGILTEPGKVWYLPHHGVYHPKKPNKIRVVFDCSAKFEGKSLNDRLLQGPDLTNSLVGVLLRFRQESIAFMGDIEAMFYQVYVPENQYNFLRFLWWPNGNLDGMLKEYHMKVHLFGAVSSPSIANYALKSIISDQEDLDRDVAVTLQLNFYVDDCLRSVDSVPKAIDLISGLRSACTSGGFHLTKFICNNSDVLKSIPKEEHSKQLQSKDLDYSELPVEHALGVRWDVQSDCFGFSVLIPDKPFTRRGILSIVSTIYDPLGFIAPFVLPAKKLLQSLCCQESLMWDDCIPDAHSLQFKKWMTEVPVLETIAIERCLKPPNYGTVLSSQVHIFSDASTSGYGSVAYLRICNSTSVHVAFLFGKARVSPVKTTSIPRLELTAATVSVQIGQKLKRELDIPIDDLVYHTDSLTVLHYIYSETRRFPVFVANRIQQIRDFSKPAQWRYVNTELNPADDASRGMKASELCNNSRWLQGPTFLKFPKSEWPQQPVFTCGVDEESVTVAAMESKPNCTDNLLLYYSSWYKLKRATAVFLKLIDLLRMRITKPRVTNDCADSSPFSVDMLGRAEIALLKYVQHKEYQKEIMILEGIGLDSKRGRASSIPKSSNVYRLDPFISGGLLRVGGRLSRSTLMDINKHPVLLPTKTHITTLIIRDIHESLAHAGRNHVVSKLREKYWIVATNAAVRRCINQCIVCRRLRRPRCEQKMADLPSEQVEPAPPFTYCGVDFFGPFIIKERRKELKRYGALFVCLASKAIHIEVANSLETDSFINALRRFISLRGPVREILCDNGTNFRGAAQELQRALDGMDNSRVKGMLLRHGITWKFNTPTASHMGGIWERQIRTIRNILSSLLHDHGSILDDEGFRTLLCEVQAIINSRPLTLSANEPGDLESLTPNHILTMKPVVLPPPGDFHREDLYVKKRWKRVQYLSDLFWSRWKKEYLVGLQQRVKWSSIQRNLQVGDVVLLEDDSTNRFKWPMGRVTATVPDDKGIVRSVYIEIGKSTFKRPIHKIILLIPIEEQ